MIHKITINGLLRGDWIRAIARILNNTAYSANDTIKFELNSITQEKELTPFMLVMLACLAHELNFKRRMKLNISAHKTVLRYLDIIDFKKYHTFSATHDPTILNLWKISNNEKETHANRVHDYLKNTYFQNRDLSALKLCILELYYNIFDHAEADGNAYTYIRYDDNTKKLNIAICDFGKGIASTIRTKYPSQDDSSAISKALEDGVTIGSRIHNKGRGLGNILGVLFNNNSLRIVSNKGTLLVKGDKSIKPKDSNVEFPGTLIYFDVSMDKFENDEIMPTFDF